MPDTAIADPMSTYLQVYGLYRCKVLPTGVLTHGLLENPPIHSMIVSYFPINTSVYKRFPIQHPL